jgi:hypothetical protein
LLADARTSTDLIVADVCGQRLCDHILESCHANDARSAHRGDLESSDTRDAELKRLHNIHHSVAFLVTNTAALHLCPQVKDSTSTQTFIEVYTAKRGNPAQGLDDSAIGLSHAFTSPSIRAYIHIRHAYLRHKSQAMLRPLESEISSRARMSVENASKCKCGLR